MYYLGQRCPCDGYCEKRFGFLQMIGPRVKGRECDLLVSGLIVWVLGLMIEGGASQAQAQGVSVPCPNSVTMPYSSANATYQFNLNQFQRPPGFGLVVNVGLSTYFNCTAQPHGFPNVIAPFQSAAVAQDMQGRQTLQCRYTPPRCVAGQSPIILSWQSSALLQSNGYACVVSGQGFSCTKSGKK